MLIGISGKMGVGKTTLADHLARRLTGARMSFAAELRKEVAEHFDLPLEAVFDNAMKSCMVVPVGYKYMTLREVLQWWGQQRREADPDYWIKRLISRTSEARNPIIVDDVRYTNEADAIQQAGGVVLRLEPYAGWTPGKGADHTSETDLDGYDFDYRYKPKYGSLFELAYQIQKEIC